MRVVRHTLARIAPSPLSRADVLVQGETGTGKELVVCCLHDLSGLPRPLRRAQLRWPARDTLFESEIFGHEAGAFTGAGEKRIGEIESMPMAMQIRFLRVLQERVIERLDSNHQIPVDFRVVTATKVDLAEHCRAGLLRIDLYFHLNVAAIELRPLRAPVGEDIPLLLEHFLAQAAQGHNGRGPVELADETLRDLMAYV